MHPVHSYTKKNKNILIITAKQSMFETIAIPKSILAYVSRINDYLTTIDAAILPCKNHLIQGEEAYWQSTKTNIDASINTLIFKENPSLTYSKSLLEEHYLSIAFVFSQDTLFNTAHYKTFLTHQLSALIGANPTHTNAYQALQTNLAREFDIQHQAVILILHWGLSHSVSLPTAFKPAHFGLWLTFLILMQKHAVESLLSSALAIIEPLFASIRLHTVLDASPLTSTTVIELLKLLKNPCFGEQGADLAQALIDSECRVDNAEMPLELEQLIIEYALLNTTNTRNSLAHDYLLKKAIGSGTITASYAQLKKILQKALNVYHHNITTLSFYHRQHIRHLRHQILALTNCNFAAVLTCLTETSKTLAQENFSTHRRQSIADNADSNGLLTLLSDLCQRTAIVGMLQPHEEAATCQSIHAHYLHAMLTLLKNYLCSCAFDDEKKTSYVSNLKDLFSVAFETAFERAANLLLFTVKLKALQAESGNPQLLTSQQRAAFHFIEILFSNCHLASLNAHEPLLQSVNESMESGIELPAIRSFKLPMAENNVKLNVITSNKATAKTALTSSHTNSLTLYITPDLKPPTEKIMTATNTTQLPIMQSFAGSEIEMIFIKPLLRSESLNH